MTGQDPPGCGCEKNGSATQKALAQAGGGMIPGISLALITERPAFILHCKPSFGGALGDVFAALISVQTLVELLTPLNARGIKGTSRTHIYRYMADEAYPDWLLTKHIIYHSAHSSAFHRQCLVYGWVRNDFFMDSSKGIKVPVLEEVITANANTLLQDYNLFVECEEWRS